MFVQSTGNHRNGQDEEMGNPASTSITVIWNEKLILGGLNARKTAHNNRGAPYFFETRPLVI
jgi:hypothetical protein